MNFKIPTPLFSLFSLLLILGSTISFTQAAEVPLWKIIPDESSLSFTATQNNAPVTGTFKSFSGEISADPDHLEASHVKIIVEMNSVTTSLKDIEDALKTSDWFNVSSFPQAIFESSQFIKTNGNALQAKGTLSLKGKSLPVVLNFTFENISDNKTKATGHAQLIRADFGVGQGEWSSTEEIKNEVQVNFVITATKSQ
ncbi:YceI family protein [Legionella waltersii]|uniref:YceI family protein n=1 Tax=Legionella waltersii TaxID=66969 RepID=UPI00080260C7|nr:YceI family protein [Legionella waltersii]